MIISTNFTFFLFPGLQVTCFARFSEYFTSNFHDMNFLFYFWQSTISGMQDTETMLNGHLDMLLIKSKIFYVII